MTIFNIKQINEQISRKYPANLIFCQTEDLLAIVSNEEDYSEQVRIPCIAELFTRYCLWNKEESQIASVLDQILPNRERQSLDIMLNQDIMQSLFGSKKSIELWPASTPYSQRCEALAKNRLREVLSQVDGFIPVYFTTEQQDGYFIPFHFEECSPQNEANICDLQGKIIEAWQPNYQKIIDPTTKLLTCVIHCCQNNLLPPLEGNSFMLSIFIAYQRYLRKLPHYPAHCLFATGSIEKHRLQPVEIEGKLTAFLKKPIRPIL